MLTRESADAVAGGTTRAGGSQSFANCGAALRGPAHYNSLSKTATARREGLPLQSGRPRIPPKGAYIQKEDVGRRPLFCFFRAQLSSLSNLISIVAHCARVAAACGESVSEAVPVIIPRSSAQAKAPRAQSLTDCAST